MDCSLQKAVLPGLYKTKKTAIIFARANELLLKLVGTYGPIAKAFRGFVRKAQRICIGGGRFLCDMASQVRTATGPIV